MGIEGYFKRREQKFSLETFQLNCSVISKDALTHISRNKFSVKILCVYFSIYKTFRWLHPFKQILYKIRLYGYNVNFMIMIFLLLLTAKFRLKLKKVGKTSGPFMYDVNQIPCDYTVEVTNRFKGLDLTESAWKNYGQWFVTLYKRWWSKPSPRKGNARRKNGFLKRPYKQMRKKEKLKANEKQKDIPNWIQSFKE